MRRTYCRILSGAFPKSRGGNLNSLTLQSPPAFLSSGARPARRIRTRFKSTFLNKYTELLLFHLPLAPPGSGFFRVLKRVHPCPASALENPSIVSIRSPPTRENRAAEQQSQFTAPSCAGSPPARPSLTNTSLKRPLERATKERRAETEAEERAGKGRETASFGNRNAEGVRDVDDHEDGNDDSGDVEEDDGDGDGDGDGEGKVKTRWESEGVG